MVERRCLRYQAGMLVCGLNEWLLWHDYKRKKRRKKSFDGRTRQVDSNVEAVKVLVVRCEL